MIILNSNSDVDSIMEMETSAPQTPQTSPINNTPSTSITPTKTGTTSSAFSMNSPDWLTQSCPAIKLENKSNSSININISKKRKTNIPIIKTNEKKNRHKNQFQII